MAQIQSVQSLIDMVVFTQVSDGSNTKFWKGRWLNGSRIKEIVPAVYDLVPKRIKNRRTVKEAMLHLGWVSDFQGALTVVVLLQYFKLFQELDQVVLQPEVRDKHILWLSPTCNFFSTTVYIAMFQGFVSFQLAERVWKTWAPSKCKFFIWLVEHNRCWTMDKLARRGMDCLE
jgi:hypothetical protein